MAATPPSWFFFRAHYLKKDSTNQSEFFTVYCHILEDLHYWISGQSKIQYGLHAAILDFLSGALSHEGFKHQILNFYSLFAHITGPALSFFRLIQNPIWPPCHLFGDIGTYQRMRAVEFKAVYHASVWTGGALLWTHSSPNASSLTQIWQKSMSDG